MRTSLAPLGERNFRLLFCAQAIWLLGSWMTPVALAFAVLSLTDSPSALGLVLGAEAVPLTLLLLVGGVWADRLPRVRVMVTADLVSVVSQGTTAVLLIAGSAEVWQLVALAAVAGAADAFHTPAWAGLLPETVPPPMLQRANALRHLESNAGRVAGPLLAGVIIAAAGAGWAIAADALSFLLAAAILVRVDVPARAIAGQAASFVAELKEGWRAVRAESWLIVMMIDTGLWMLVIWGPYAVLGPIVCERELGGAGSWALISAGYGLGSIGGGVLGLRLHPRRPLLVAIVINAVFLPLLASLAVASPAWTIAAMAVPAGASTSLYMVLWDTTLQERVPREALARVSSFERISVFAPLPIGMALAGPVAQWIGVEATLWVSAAWLGVSTVFLLSIPSIRRMERPAHDPLLLGSHDVRHPAPLGPDDRRDDGQRDHDGRHGHLLPE
jgi:MFS family permease